MLLKNIAKESHIYAVNDEQEEVAIKIYEHMSEEDKNEKNGIFLKNYLLENEKYILNAIFAHENVELPKIYLNSVISTYEDLQFAVGENEGECHSVVIRDHRFISRYLSESSIHLPIAIGIIDSSITRLV